MIKINSELGKMTYEQMIFPGGEISVRLNESLSPLYVELVANIESAKDLIELFMLTDAIRRRSAPNVNIQLIMPYVPYARQDRVSVPGEALSISVLANLINSQNYSSVEIWDPHSDVTTALLNNVFVVPQEIIAQGIPVDWENTILVAPDAGAAKKIYKLAEIVGSEVITASKVRNPKNGKISGTKVYDAFDPTKNLLIVDDICDGGRTFIELAKVLKPGTISLYVTHGIFSKGLNVFDGLIDNIYCANSWIEDKRITLV